MYVEGHYLGMWGCTLPFLQLVFIKGAPKKGKRVSIAGRREYMIMIKTQKCAHTEEKNTGIYLVRVT